MSSELSLIFHHQPFQFPSIERKEVNGRRHYATSEGKVYPSVTTVLSGYKDEGLKQWIAKVGSDVANRKKIQGANRGTGIHTIYEDFVSNRLDIQQHDPITYSLFKESERYLREGMNKVHNLEFAVWSDRLKTAGTADSLCEWCGITSILDYKTSGKPKKEEWIENYFIQETVYAMCVYERIGLKVPQIVTFLVNERDPEPQIFVKRTEDYILDAIRIFRDYHRRNNEAVLLKATS